MSVLLLTHLLAVSTVWMSVCALGAGARPVVSCGPELGPAHFTTPLLHWHHLFGLDKWPELFWWLLSSSVDSRFLIQTGRHQRSNKETSKTKKQSTCMSTSQATTSPLYTFFFKFLVWFGKRQKASITSEFTTARIYTVVSIFLYHSTHISYLRKTSTRSVWEREWCRLIRGPNIGCDLKQVPPCHFQLAAPQVSY